MLTVVVYQGTSAFGAQDDRFRDRNAPYACLGMGFGDLLHVRMPLKKRGRDDDVEAARQVVGPPIFDQLPNILAVMTPGVEVEEHEVRGRHRYFFVELT